jgi:hypothetical protein
MAKTYKVVTKILPNPILETAEVVADKEEEIEDVLNNKYDTGWVLDRTGGGDNFILLIFKKT